jgi:HSP20 family protein
VPKRDLFANFDRMRREMDELFGDMLERTGMTRRGGAFSPAVDVVYASNPPRAIVTAELAGVDADALDIEIQGKKLILSGRRAPAAVQGDLYQQVEIERGHFRRVVELGAEVRSDQAQASYEAGMLRIELPLAPAASPPHAVPIATGERT